MSETKRKLRNSKQTDLTELSEGAFVTLTFHIRHDANSSVPVLDGHDCNQLTQVYDLDSCVGQNNLLGQSNTSRMMFAGFISCLFPTEASVMLQAQTARKESPRQARVLPASREKAVILVSSLYKQQ